MMLKTLNLIFLIKRILKKTSQQLTLNLLILLHCNDDVAKGFIIPSSIFLSYNLY